MGNVGKKQTASHSDICSQVFNELRHAELKHERKEVDPISELSCVIKKLL